MPHELLPDMRASGAFSPIKTVRAPQPALQLCLEGSLVACPGLGPGSLVTVLLVTSNQANLQPVKAYQRQWDWVRAFGKSQVVPREKAVLLNS